MQRWGPAWWPHPAPLLRSDCSRRRSERRRDPPSPHPPSSGAPRSAPPPSRGSCARWRRPIRSWPRPAPPERAGIALWAPCWRLAGGAAAVHRTHRSQLPRPHHPARLRSGLCRPPPPPPSAAAWQRDAQIPSTCPCCECAKNPHGRETPQRGGGGRGGEAGDGGRCAHRSPRAAHSALLPRRGDSADSDGGRTHSGGCGCRHRAARPADGGAAGAAAGGCRLCVEAGRPAGGGGGSLLDS